MIGLGTVINVVFILVGSALGVLIGHRIPERTRRTVTDGIGLVYDLVAARFAIAVGFPPAPLLSRKERPGKRSPTSSHIDSRNSNHSPRYLIGRRAVALNVFSVCLHSMIPASIRKATVALPYQPAAQYGMTDLGL